MKKALIVSTVSRQFYLFEQGNIEVLRELGYEVHGAANFADRSERLKEVAIVEHQIDFERSPFSLKNIKAYRQLKELMKTESFDLLHCHSPVGGVIARLVGRQQKGLKVLYTAHGFHFFKGASLLHKCLFFPIEWLLSFWTDALITINEEDFKLAQKRFHMKRLYKVDGIGLDFERFHSISKEEQVLKKKALGLEGFDHLLIYVGELSHRKNQAALIEMMPAVLERFPKTGLLLVGRGDLMSTYQDMIDTKGLSHAVKLLGFRNDVPSLMQVADIAVSSSKQEGLPVNLMEAMGVGLPLIVNNCRGNRDLVQDGVNGLLVTANATEEWQASVETLLANMDQRDCFGQKNLARANRYSKAQIKLAMAQIYGEVYYD